MDVESKHRKLDTVSEVETPEGILISLAPAGALVRVLAYSIDWLIRTLVLIILYFIFDYAGEVGYGLGLIAYFLLEWFYPVYFECFHQGVTPGKKRMKIMVVHDDGTPLSFSSSIIRNILRAADFFPMAYVTGLIAMVTHKQYKRLGDIAAGTLVVYQRQKSTPTVAATEQSRPVPIALYKDEQDAILAFAERRQTFSEPRQNELAGIVAPTLQLEENQAIEEIDKIANGIIGQS